MTGVKNRAFKTISPTARCPKQPRLDMPRHGWASHKWERLVLIPGLWRCARGCGALADECGCTRGPQTRKGGVCVSCAGNPVPATGSERPDDWCGTGRA